MSHQVLEKHMRFAVEQLLSSLFPEHPAVSNRDVIRDGTCISAGLSVVGGIDYGAPPPPRVIPADAHPTQGAFLLQGVLKQPGPREADSVARPQRGNSTPPLSPPLPTSSALPLSRSAKRGATDAMEAEGSEEEVLSSPRTQSIAFRRGPARRRRACAHRGAADPRGGADGAAAA